MLVGRAVALVVVAGCGRFGFGPADGEGIDATTDAPSGDGAQGDSGTIACGTQDLVLYLRFDESAGTTALDSSGSGNTGTVTRDGRWVGGRIGGALDLTGTETVSVGSAASLDDLGSLTVCTYVNFDGGTPFAGIVDKSEDGLREGWNFYLTATNQLGFYTNYGAYREGGSVSLGEWHYLCATWDGTATETGIVLYADGAVAVPDVASEGSFLQSDADHPMTIGATKNDLYRYNGRLDELRIYDRALSMTEIQMHSDCVAGL